MNPEDSIFNNPAFLGMDPEKLQFILSFAQKDKPKSMKDAMPFLLANMNIAKKKNLNFSTPEVQIIAELLSKDLPDNEKEKIRKMLSVMNQHSPNS